jgi:hypothetical protein
MSENKYECPFEREVSMNLESGDIKPHIRSHIEECGLCRDTAAVYNWMNRFQQASVTEMEQRMPKKKLPTADEIWKGAFAPPPLTLRRQPVKPDEALVKKAMLPMRITQAAAAVVIAGGLLYFLASNFPAVGDFFSDTLGFGSMFKTFSNVMKKSAAIPLIYFLPMVIAIFGIVAFIFASDGAPAQSTYRKELNGGS